MTFDPLVANPGRLQILTALASRGTQEFVHLRSATRLTDGNLSSHARRLAAAGFVRIDKSFRGGKPLTRLHLTDEGRAALTSHAQELLAAVSLAETKPVATHPSSPLHADDWVD